MRLATLTCATALAGLSLSIPTYADTSGTDGVTWTTTVNKQAAALVPDAVKAKGIITVASDASYPPFEYFDTDNKTIIGYDIDVSDAIAATLDLKAEHVNAGFDSILPGLAAGKYDMAMSAFGVTPEREKVVDFVAPYFEGGTGLAVAAGNPLGLKMDPKVLCGHAIGGEAGSFQVITFLPKMSEDCVSASQPPITIRIYKTQNDANLALLSKRVDGVMADSAPLAYQSELAKGRFELAPGADYEPTVFGIALPKDSPLKPAIQAALTIIEADGTLDKILKRWDLSEDWVAKTGS